jgi:hypothetical protein
MKRFLTSGVRNEHSVRVVRIHDLTVSSARVYEERAASSLNVLSPDQVISLSDPEDIQ